MILCLQPPMNLRIAISGSAGTGKTTLAQALAERLDVPYLEEGFRERREAGLDLHDLSRAEHQALLMELYEEARSQAMACPDGFVQDRCPLDFLAFWLHYGFWGEDGMTASLFERAQSDLAAYDRVIVLPWGACGIEADGVRSTNRWLQLKYQALFEGLAHRLAPEGLIHWMPNEITDEGKRVVHVQEVLNGGQ